MHDWRPLSKQGNILQEVGLEASYINEYEVKIADSLTASKLIGNSYIVSVWLGVISHFDTERNNLEGERLGVGSYGSGSSAIVCSFIVQPEYQELSRKCNLLNELGQRQGISMEAYEHLHEGTLKSYESIIPPTNEFALDYIGMRTGKSPFSVRNATVHPDT